MEGTHYISLIHGLPSKMLYCFSPPKIWHNVGIIFIPNCIGKIIVLIVEEMASSKALNVKVESLMCEGGRFKCFKATTMMILIPNPVSINTLLY